MGQKCNSRPGARDGQRNGGRGQVAGNPTSWKQWGPQADKGKQEPPD